MAPTTMTTIALVVFALGLLAMASYAWFGSWQPVVRRISPRDDDEVETAVLEMRRSIEDYERRQRS
jgi:cytochrome c-type biogenesis protein CcmH/NrfG